MEQALSEEDREQVEAWVEEAAKVEWVVIGRAQVLKGCVYALTVNYPYRIK
jgi:hypothetical protein